MTPNPRPHRHLRIGALLHRWHRRIGVFAAAFLVWLAISGLLLNESATLGLDQTRIGWPWLMQLYGLHDASLSGLQAGNHWLVAHEEQTLLDGQPLTTPIAAPLGAVQLGDILYVATRNSIVLVRANDGLRVDELLTPPLPATPLRRIGHSGDWLVIDNGRLYQSRDGEAWQALAASDVQWSSAQALPAAELERSGLRASLPLTRVLADLHSGQLFGRGGKTLIDLVALAALLLVTTGVWSLLRRRRIHH